MLANWFDAHDSADLLRRLDGLTLSARPRWGTFSPADLVCHLTDPVRVALGSTRCGAFRMLPPTMRWHRVRCLAS